MDIPSSIRAVGQKQALHAQLEGARLPRKAIADLLEVAPQTLSAWADDHVDSHIPSARIPAVLVNTPESDALLTYWAGLTGRAVVTLPRAATLNADVSQMAELAQTFAELLRQHADASADGKWTQGEIDRLRPVVTELAARALAHLEYVQRQVKVETMPARRSA